MNRPSSNVKLVTDESNAADGPSSDDDARFRVLQPTARTFTFPAEVLQLVAEGPPAYVADTTGRILFVNEAFRELARTLNYRPTRECADDAGLVDHVLPLAEVLAEIAATDAAVRREDVRKIDGRVLYLTSEHRPLRDAQGRITAVGGIVSDSSREASAWIEALSARERFRDIARLVSDWLWETDGNFDLTFVSTRVIEVLGLHPRHLIGRNLFSLGTFDTGMSGVKRPSPASRSPFRNVPFSIASASGEQYLFQLSGIPVFEDATGTFKGFRGTARDITAEGRAQREVERSQRRLSAAIENISEGFALWGREQRLHIVNPRFRTMFMDFAVDAVEGLTFDAFLERAQTAGFFTNGAADVALWRQARAEALAGAGGGATVRLADGRWLRISEHRTGYSYSVVSILSDITELKGREEALLAAKDMAEVANRSKGEFLANMSHELRTPLNAIIGFSEIMERGTFGPLGSERYRGYVTDIIRSSRHLLGIINDILDTAKMEAGKLDLDEDVFDLADEVRETARLLSEQAARAQIAVTVGTDANLPRLYADRRKVRQIVLNLVSNAIKFTPPAGRVAVRLGQRATGALFVAVADTGIGIAIHDIPKVLAPFGQVEGSLNRRHEGTGLGLPLTKALAELHDGSLTIASEPGKGTEVTVEFPPTRTRTGAKA